MASSAGRLLPRRWRGDATIFVMHRLRRDDQRVVDSDFYLTVSQLELLLDHIGRRGHEVVSLSTLLERLASPQEDRRPMVALTFDDGYRDNFELAAPVFARRNVPWTLYVASGIIDRTCPYWWGALERLVERRDSIDIEIPGLHASLPTRTPLEKQAAYHQIARVARHHGTATCDYLASRYGTSAASLLDEDAMTWVELARLARDPLVTIGAHGVTHRALASMPLDEAVAEIVDSRERIRAMTGSICEHFSLPFGTSGTWLPEHAAAIKDAGFRSMVTTEPANCFELPVTSAYELPRITLQASAVNTADIDAHLSGLSGLMTQRSRHPAFRRAVAASTPSARPVGIGASTP